MSIIQKRKTWRYLVVVTFSLLGLIFIVSVWPVIAPFIVALFLAYLLSPTLGKMTNLGIPIILSLLVIYFYLFIGVYFILVVTVPIILEQLRNLLAYLPDILSSVGKFFDSFSQHTTSAGINFDFQKIFDGIVANMDERIGSYSAQLADMVFSLPQLLLYLVLAPILSYYFLRDRELIKMKLVYLFSPTARAEVLRIGGEINHLLREFINGYLVIALIMAIVATIFYYIVGIEYPVVLGLLMGIGDLIPYFGPVIAAIPAVLLAAAASPLKTVIVIIGILLLQQLDGSVVTPRIIGDRIGLHPVTTIFVVIAGGYLWGIVGAILAIPMAAVLILIAKYIWGRVFAEKNDKLSSNSSEDS